MAEVDGDLVMDPEPFFYDEEATISEAAAAAERREHERQEKARKREAAAARRAAHEAALESIREYDPDEERYIYTRYHYEDLSVFDLDEVSDIAPMRFTATPCPPGQALRFVTEMVNVLTVRVILPGEYSSGQGIYGSVIARDDLDLKYDYIYIEIDLKMKMNDDQQDDKRLSKGLEMINGVLLDQYSSENEAVVQSLTLPSSTTRPCTVQIAYSYISYGLEATISVELLHYQGQRGHFCGQITACTSTIQDSILLHDSKLLAAGGVMAADCNGHTAIPLLRRVMAVSLYEMLIVTIVAQSGDGVYKRTIDFTPAVNGGDEARIVCGLTSLLVKVNWSTMNIITDE
uniref:DUF6598 domain-containing protein n=1 Tax=Leersia perrieri TaxID=77586 RepID=A0A0D9X2K9_9ORYZ